MKYIVHIEGWGYYGGRNVKYADMFAIVPKNLAKKFDSIEEAEKIAKLRRTGGYIAEIEQVAE